MADELRMLIDGSWVGPLGGATFDATAPATGEIIALGSGS
jgi:acyl-CoA reductase-like NAD-dependent aldehyde dehydrogenase